MCALFDQLMKIKEMQQIGQPDLGLDFILHSLVVSCVLFTNRPNSSFTSYTTFVLRSSKMGQAGADPTTSLLG